MRQNRPDGHVVFRIYSSKNDAAGSNFVPVFVAFAIIEVTEKPDAERPARFNRAGRSASGF
jgi:hypothetical protein